LLSVVLILIITPCVFSEKKTVDINKFEDTVYESGGLTFNNFVIFEKDGWITPNGWRKLNIKLTGKNTSGDPLRLELQFAGLDNSGEVLWAMSASPIMGILSEQSVEEISSSVLVKPGTLSKTKVIVIIFTGEI